MTKELLPAARKPHALDGTIVLTLIAVGVVAALLALGGFFLGGPATALGIALGGIVATVNLWIFAQVVRGVLGGGSRGKLWAVGGALKFLALFGGAWLLLRSGWTSPLTLAIGYGALPLGVSFGALLRPRDELPREDLEQPQSTGVPSKDLVTGSPAAKPHGD